MNNVVVICLDGKEVFFENATFTVECGPKCILISDQNDKVIATFNFDNVAGVRMI